MTIIVKTLKPKKVGNSGNGKMNEYDYEVNLGFSGNQEAKSKKEALELIKESFKDEFNLDLIEEEITITKVEK